MDLWFKILKWFKPDAVDYVGDISDQDCYSRFSDGRTNEFLNQFKGAEDAFPIVVDNEKAVKEFYAKTRTMLPNADIFASLGNHDIRVFDYADKKLPDLVDKITPDALWDFKNLGIDYIHYGDLPKHRFGDIYVHHGIAISKHSGESVRSDIDNFGVSLIRGHSHRAGVYFKTYEMRNEMLRGYELGHLTDIKSEGMAYTSLHNWQPGFAIAYVESGSTATADGLWPHIQLITISPDYTCYIGNKKFEG
jgi:hypothetical protein